MTAWIPALVASIVLLGTLVTASLTYRNGRASAQLAREQSSLTEQQARLTEQSYYHQLTEDLRTELSQVKEEVRELRSKIESMRVTHDQQLRDLTATHAKEKADWIEELARVRDGHVAEIARLYDRVERAEQKQAEAEDGRRAAELALKRCSDQVVALSEKPG